MHSETIKVNVRNPLWVLFGSQTLGLKIIQCKVENLVLNKYGIFLDLQGQINDKGFKSRFHIDLYGKEFFLKKEQAERKIQELKENK